MAAGFGGDVGRQKAAGLVNLAVYRSADDNNVVLITGRRGQSRRVRRVARSQAAMKQPASGTRGELPASR